MGFFRQEHWCGLPFPTPGDLPNPGIESASLMSPALAGEFFTTAPPEKPIYMIYMICMSYIIYIHIYIYNLPYLPCSPAKTHTYGFQHCLALWSGLTEASQSVWSLSTSSVVPHSKCLESQSQAPFRRQNKLQDTITLRALSSIRLRPAGT